MKSIKKFILGAVSTSLLLLPFISCAQKDNFNGRWIAGTQDYSIEFNSSKNFLTITQGDQVSNGSYELSKWNSMLVTLDRYEYLGQDETDHWEGMQDTFMFDMKKDSDGNLIIANFSDSRLIFKADNPSKEFDGVYRYNDDYEELTLTLNKAEGTFIFKEIIVDEQAKATYQAAYPNFTEEGILQLISGKYRTEEEELLSLYTSYSGLELIQDLDYKFSDDKKMITIGGVNFFKADGKSKDQINTQASEEGPVFDEEYLKQLLDKAAQGDGSSDEASEINVEEVPAE